MQATAWQNRGWILVGLGVLALVINITMLGSFTPAKGDVETDEVPPTNTNPPASDDSTGNGSGSDSSGNSKPPLPDGCESFYDYMERVFIEDMGVEPCQWPERKMYDIDTTSPIYKNMAKKWSMALYGLSKVPELKWSLTAGSLLGAYRHKGFIPWDYDCDIVVAKTDENMEHISKLAKFMMEEFEKNGRSGLRVVEAGYSKTNKYNQKINLPDEPRGDPAFWPQFLDLQRFYWFEEDDICEYNQIDIFYGHIGFSMKPSDEVCMCEYNELPALCFKEPTPIFEKAYGKDYMTPKEKKGFWTDFMPCSIRNEDQVTKAKWGNGEFCPEM